MSANGDSVRIAYGAKKCRNKDGNADIKKTRLRPRFFMSVGIFYIGTDNFYTDISGTGLLEDDETLRLDMEILRRNVISAVSHFVQEFSAVIREVDL